MYGTQVMSSMQDTTEEGTCLFFSVLVLHIYTLWLGLYSHVDPSICQHTLRVLKVAIHKEILSPICPH
ncbi:hypothetical protein XELAEV_18015917mg [Xenopus laevis]|uniref:Uncharacterized protein n=1 Tax=Xenopus laevis TaxID=8355 RepID=A0A974DKJ0_XENLA|nr:hypothetical protein XELAEV_18015917mg [Xenopus laevis]